MLAAGSSNSLCSCRFQQYPGENQAKMIESFINSDEGIQLDYDIVPFRCKEDFIGTNVRLAALNTWSITSKFIRRRVLFPPTALGNNFAHRFCHQLLLQLTLLPNGMWDDCDQR